MNIYVLVGILSAIVVLLLVQVVLTIRQSRRPSVSVPVEPQNETAAPTPEEAPAEADPVIATRDVLEDLSSRFDLSASGGQRLVLQIFFTDQLTSPAWYLTMSGGRCNLSEGYASSATTTITTPTRLWGQIVAGRTSADAAFISGKIQVDGDSSLLARLGQIFPTRESDAPETVAEAAEPEPAPVVAESVPKGPLEPFLLAAGDAPIEPFGPAQEAIARLTLNLPKPKNDQAPPAQPQHEQKDADPAPERASC